MTDTAHLKTAHSDTAEYDTAILDVDGTLVDSNYHHALAWFRAFRRHDITLPLWRLHRAIGMGGDKLVELVAGEKVEQELGDALRAAWEGEFKTLSDEVQPFDGAQSLLEALRERGFRIVLASSGKTDQVERSLDLIGGKDLADAWTTSDDADNSKPAPDIVQVALDRVSGAHGVMIGDSTWDCIAAGKLDIPTIAVRTGGFSTEELQNAGAIAVYDSLIALRDDLDNTPLGQAATSR